MSVAGSSVFSNSSGESAENPFSMRRTADIVSVRVCSGPLRTASGRRESTSEVVTSGATAAQATIRAAAGSVVQSRT